MAAAAFRIAITSPAQTRFKQLPSGHCGFDLNNSLRFYSSRSRCFSLHIASNSKTKLTTPLLSSKSQIHSLSCFGWGGGGKEDETGAVSCESYVNNNGGQNSDDDVPLLGWFQRMLLKLNIMMNGDEQYPYEIPIRCLFLAWVVSQGYSYYLLTFIGVGSLGVGFAAASFATDILKNVFLWIHFYNIFRIGDIVKVGSIEGKVVEIGLTRTTLQSIDNFLLTVPNSCFLEEVVVNESCVAYKAILTKIPLQEAPLLN